MKTIQKWAAVYLCDKNIIKIHIIMETFYSLIEALWWNEGYN